jgi:hypothetical protein
MSENPEDTIAGSRLEDNLPPATEWAEMTRVCPTNTH